MTDEIKIDRRKNRPLEEIHPKFRPRWKHVPTTAIRVPAEFSEVLLEIARRLDNQTISIEDVEAAIATKTAEIKSEVLGELRSILKNDREQI